MNKMFELNVIEDKINACKLLVEDKRFATIFSQGIKKDERDIYIAITGTGTPNRGLIANLQLLRNLSIGSTTIATTTQSASTV